MPEIKNSFIKGRMNLDLDKRIIPNGEYGEALNIQVSTSEDSDVGSVQNILGNTKISTFLDGLANTDLICIGSISDEKKNRFYWFVVATNVISDVDLASAIIEYNVEADPATAVTPIVIDSDNTRLEFSSNNYITGINIVDDILFFTDGLTEPKKINIEHFRLNGHTDIYDTTNSAFIQSNFFVDNVNVGAFTKENITVIKQKPTKPPVLELTSTPVFVYDDTGFVSMQAFSFLPYTNLDSTNPNPIIRFNLVNYTAVAAGIPNTDINGNPEDYQTLNPNLEWPFTGPNAPTSGFYNFNIRDARGGVPFAVGDIVLMSDPNAPGSLPNNAQIRLEVINIEYLGGGIPPSVRVGTYTGNTENIYAEVEFEVLSVDPSLSIDEISFNYALENPDDVLYETDFVRFSYRYKYQDGEYSAFGPFTQTAFLPGIFNIHPTREPYNVAMENNIKEIILKDFVTHDIPKEVVEIDLLVKLENSTVIYSIDTIKPKKANGTTDNPAWHTVDGITNNITLPSTTESASDTGYYKLTTDLVYAAIAEKQFLRPYDNVPKKAKAQDFTAGRLIYGNYTQNIDLSPANYSSMKLNLENRSFHTSTTNNFVTGQKSIKSQRTYQTGISYLDIYGRETPVFTSNENNSLRIPFLDSSGNTNASKSSRLFVNNLGYSSINNFTNQTPGFDPVYFKIFIKETASEYYNLVLDRVYRAKEDGNLWLSFPSSDRDKIKKDDFIILKKAIDVSSQVEDENKFKVIDIQNEAPEFIRTKFQLLGTLDGQGTLTGAGGLYPITDSQPAADKNKFSINKQSFTDENVSTTIPPGETMAISFSKTSGSVQLVSRKYEIITIQDNSSSNVFEFTLDKPIFSQDGWIESSTGVLDASLKTQIFLAKNKQWEEFQGRFFVKILRNLITAEFLENQIGVSAAENILISTKQLFSLIDPNLYLAKPQNFQTSTPNTNNNSATVSNWQESLKFGGSTVTSGWFIDGARFVSHQPVVSSNLSLWGGYGSPSATPGPNGLLFDVSTSTNLIKTGHSSNTPLSTSFGTSGWIYNTYQDSNGVGGTNPVDNFFSSFDGTWVDGLEGIIQANSGYNGVSKPKAWRTQAGTFADVGEDVYGAQGTQGFYMHLSFSSVGTQLHDGTGLNASSVAVEDFYDSSSVNCNVSEADPNALLNLQAIDNFNCQANPKNKVCNLQQSSTLNTTATENQWNPAGHPALGNFSQTNKDLIENLIQGSKFRFANDSSDTIFTILNVYEKRIYNHTSWNKRLVWNPQLSVLEEDTSTVHYKWHQFVYHCINNNNISAINTFNSLQDKIKDFASPDNRRVCYILELDKNPDDLINNPENLAGPLTTVESTFIEFVEPNYENGVNPVSDNPAVFETEPKENLDLDIFYEASQAYPIELDKDSVTATNNGYLAPDNRKGYLIGSVGDKVRCNIELANTNTYSGANQDPIYVDNRVKDWDGDIVHLDRGLLTLPVATPTSDSLSDQTNEYNGKHLQFHKLDGSYVQMPITEVLEIDTTDPNQDYITKVRVGPKVARVGLSYFNCFSFGNGVESNRIRDDFNRVFITNGVKASTILQEQYKQDDRTSGLIFSGIYNKSTSLNDLNQFIMADKITKELEPTYGSIQKLFARDSDLIAFCEDKVVQIAADKDIIFNADGNPQLTASNKVLGQSRPFVGEYGISKNPESFASSSYRAYFADKQRGAVLRLSMDGLTPVSSAGMKDWFRDKFKGDYFNIVGSYDTNKDTYNLTFDSGANFDDTADFKDTLSSVTISYKESVKGWESFKGFIAESGLSCVNSYFTFRDGNLYSHDNQTRNNFYDDQQISFISTVINNEPTTVKHFNTLNYDGEKGWECNFIETDLNTGDTLHHFINKENKWFTSIVDDGTLLTTGQANNVLNDSISFQGLGYPTNIEDIQ